MKKGRLYAVLSVLLIVLLCTSVAEFQTDNAYNNAYQRDKHYHSPCDKEVGSNAVVYILKFNTADLGEDKAHFKRKLLAVEISHASKS